MNMETKHLAPPRFDGLERLFASNCACGKRNAPLERGKTFGSLST